MLKKIKKYLIVKFNLRRPWMKQNHARKSWRRDWRYLIESLFKNNAQ